MTDLVGTCPQIVLALAEGDAAGEPESGRRAGSPGRHPQQGSARGARRLPRRRDAEQAARSLVRARRRGALAGVTVADLGRDDLLNVTIGRCHGRASLTRRGRWFARTLASSLQEDGRERPDGAALP
jgi:hypothetical protein